MVRCAKISIYVYNVLIFSLLSTSYGTPGVRLLFPWPNYVALRCIEQVVFDPPNFNDGCDGARQE